jgi:hypothetical protein
MKLTLFLALGLFLTGCAKTIHEAAAVKAPSPAANPTVVCAVS